ncbi:MAG TPA: ABC transporter substrate binding protein [Thiobacillaceae bacterium]|nr:ABC transporter substrate binding protein [Thiobacillaceae bacterium]
MRTLKGYFAKALLTLGAAVIASNGLAATIAVVLSDDSAPYQEVLGAIQSRLGSEHNLIRETPDQLASNDAALAAKLIITVGVKAADAAIKSSSKTPVIAALVPRDWYLHNGQSRLAADQRPATAVFLDQPFSRQLRLVREALPEASKLGVALSNSQTWQLRELQSQAKLMHLSVNEVIVGSELRLVESLEKILPSVDLLLALPDAEVFNRITAQTIFLTTYRYHVPVMGYSRSLTRAGALVSIFSSPEQIGQQTAEIALKVLSNGSVKLPPAQFPRYYSISINEHVARSLGLVLPVESVLLKRMQEGGERD